MRPGAARPTHAVDEVIEALDIAPLLARRTTALSGGEARRVALARALASQPRILFLDEPMVGLDTARRAEVLPYITRAVDHFGLAVLYVSHSQFEMALLGRPDLSHRRSAGWDHCRPDRRVSTCRWPRRARGGCCSKSTGTDFGCDGNAAPGEICEIRPGHGCILSADHPGRNSAAAVLPVTSVGADLGQGTARIEIAGQSIEIEADADFAAGAALWLICPRLRARRRD